ncbi:hypothetical protein [Actinomadura rupiterrae]|uniref:hypothetical protein n=1 Tax=Actinomadura rupiterrae TaxID=559627 RepID=UPI0020A386B7|nr:hypothetical protein [Actinomadura rupiterrae]MCP2337707.1 hypothetical protein [Actinomadura rupiterrae]
MRCLRSIAATTVAASLLAACGGGHKKSELGHEPTPRPTRPGQVVVIGGDPDAAGARSGAYAVDVRLPSNGGLAYDAAKHIVYFNLLSGRPDDALVGGIGPDGRLVTRVVPAQADQLAFHGGDLWPMSSHDGLRLDRVNTETGQARTYLKWQAGARDGIRVRDVSGGTTSADEADRLARYWQGSVFTVLNDGRAVVANRRGELFLVPAEGTLQAWAPKGFADALTKASGGADFGPTAVTADGLHGLVVLGRRGLIRVSDDGVTSAVAFPKSVWSLPPWTAVTDIGDGTLLLLGGIKAPEFMQARPVLVRPDGALESLKLGGYTSCGRFDGSMNYVAGGNPGGIVRLADGTFVASDIDCRRIYRFRLPEGLSGTPLR